MSCRPGGLSSGPERADDHDAGRPQRPELSEAPLEPGRVTGPPTLFELGALDRPLYIDAAAADRLLAAEDEVFVWEASGTTYVYPRVFLSPHHLVNDVIDGRPVLVSYCQLSQAALVHERVDVDGEVPVFGWLRSLYNGSLTLSDSKTGSRWTQLLGACYEGSLRGRRLPWLGELERWRWGAVRSRARVRVLSVELSMERCRELDREAESSTLGVDSLARVARIDGRLAPRARGLGVSVQGEALFIGLEELRARGVIETELGGWALLATWDPSSETARVLRRRVGGRTESFRSEGAGLVDASTGSRWTLAGECSEGPRRGERLERPLATQVAWFAWSAFHPYARIWTP